MDNYKKVFLIATAILMNICAIAQTAATNAADEKKGFMRSEGKIYVVMIVVLTILTGLLIFVSRLDRKISRLEKKRKFIISQTAF